MKKYAEFYLGLIILSLMFVHFFGLLDQSMMFSGLILILSFTFIGLVWGERSVDERDEFIRAKTDRYLYLLTLTSLSVLILFKTFAHIDYFYELILISILTFGKLVISKYLKNTH